jgi:hypothetical protein
MKKHFCFLSLVLICHAVTGQNFLVRGGLTLGSNNQDMEGMGEMKPAVGFTIGMGYEVPLNNTFSLQPELNFVQKSFKFTGEAVLGGFEISAKETYNIHYLEIPVLLKATLQTGETKVYFNFGPSLGIGIGGKHKFNISIADPNGGSDSFSSSGKIKFEEVPDEYEPSEDSNGYIENRMDVGLQLGAGIVIGGKFFIEARYGLGLTDLSDDVTSKNRVVQFTVGIPLTFNR